MKALRRADRDILLAVVVGWLVAWGGPASPQPAAVNQPAAEIRIVELQGTVELSPAGAATWVLTQTNQVLKVGDRLRTGPHSRVALRWSDQSVVSFGALTEIEILPPHAPGAQSALRLFKGILSFFHRDQPGRIRVITRGTVAGVEGTEFVLEVETVDNTERTTLSLIEGKVEFTNAVGELILTNGQQAVAIEGQAPVRTPGFIANNVLQWAFYYPAVLDPGELRLSVEERGALSESLAAYRRGDLLQGLAKYPEGRQPDSDAERIYYAALLLSVGQVEQTEELLNALNALNGSNGGLAGALRTLIAAVKRQPNPSTLGGRPPGPQLSTELLATSYYEQSRAMGDVSLKRALDLARQATTNSPEFGFAWERVAELEFSFGRTDAALEALNKSLTLSPSNAQGLALKGFLLAAQNKTREAIEWFNRAIAADSALGNAWLGRGLCKIRLTPSFFSLSPRKERSDHGEPETRNSKLETTAWEDLLIAAALEPQRALLRSYLGKAYGQAGDNKRARHELDLAKGLDPNDPTPWLYSAFLSRDGNRFNTAVGDLERSLERNDNRAVYRSRFLLDQDRAVRSSTLANLYQSVGMNEVSVREASRAASYDYANYSAHLFLSDSFNALRDPTRFNLRFETVWFNELLLANLLSPVGGTPLSQHVSQQEYSRLFEHNRIGLSTDSSYRSDGQYRELASQFGTIGNTAWALDLDYQHNNGVRPNNELDRIEWYTTIKQQFTAQDSVFLLTKYQDYHSGDNFQYFDPKAVTLTTNSGTVKTNRTFRPDFSFDEFQHPIIVAGYHHEWQAGVHTLLLGGRLVNEQRFSDRSARQLLLSEDGSGKVVASDLQPFDVTLHSDLEIYTSEISQILQSERAAVVAGALWQGGKFESSSLLTNPPPALAPLFQVPAASGSFTEDFERLKGYGYLTLSPINRVWLTGGIAYDWLKIPTNFRHPPLSSGEETRSLWEPKAALVWSPLSEVTMRGVYSRSLGGVSLDESYRLEPTQLAGFPQAFRTVISESIAGSVSAPEFETFGLALDLKLGSRTYAGVQAERIESSVRREIGVFNLNNALAPFIPSTTPEHLDYVEHSLAVGVNQLVGADFAFGLQYRFTDADLQTRLPAVPVTILSAADRSESSHLHQVNAFALFSHASGWFARAEANWYHQQNFGYSPAQPGDDFVHVNLFAGYRLAKRRAEVTVGVLNLTDRDYRLNPLTVYSELPRERVFFARLTFRL